MSRLLHWLHIELIEIEDARTQLQGRGSIKEHMKEDHSKELTLEELLNNTEILKKGPNKHTLLLTEALFITSTRP